MASERTAGVAGRRPGSDRRSGPGARRLGDEGAKKKRGGLLWMLLGLVALLLIGWLLISLLSGNDDADKAGAGSPGNGSLTAAGTALLPVPAAGLAEFDGRAAKGPGLEVVSVNGNEGFSVAKGEGDPVHVEWGGDVGTNEASRFQPEVGDKVNLTGPVQTAGPAVIERLKLDPADAQRVESQGAFVNADRVVKSQ